MKKLDLIKTASDIAFANATAIESQLDAALAAKAAELNLADQEYRQLKQYGAQFASYFRQAAQQDAAEAARAASAPKPPLQPAGA